MNNIDLAGLKFDNNGLIPAIVQDSSTNQVLMLAYMNKESLGKTLTTGETWFYSRSRQQLWHKGETSGNTQRVEQLLYDCDGDTLLVKVDQTGAACHTGNQSCFFREIAKAGEPIPAASLPTAGNLAGVLEEFYQVILDRKNQPQAGSYTCYLFEQGQDKILKKVGEETAETIIASKNNSKAEILYEMADLWYHCLVTLVYHNITPSELLAELKSRRK
jgi:phosphoribosyl-ATP pyrophosphohydrolase/phosphoribosyl-AMP cyclohydrolase